MFSKTVGQKKSPSGSESRILIKLLSKNQLYIQLRLRERTQAFFFSLEDDVQLCGKPGQDRVPSLPPTSLELGALAHLRQ